MIFVVYLIEYKIRSRSLFYCGYTSDFDRRCKEHVEGRGARVLRGKKIVGMAIIRDFSSRKEAMRHEKEMKKLTHKQKREMFLLAMNR